MTEMIQNDYILREANESDFQGIAEFLVRHSYSPIHPDWSQEEYLNWLRWKFLNNPDVTRNEVKRWMAWKSLATVDNYAGYSSKTIGKLSKTLE